MSKERFSLLFLLALIIGAIAYSPTLQSPLINLGHTIKSHYHDGIEFFKEQWENHIHQTQTIQDQREELERYRQSHLLAHQFATELSALFEANATSLQHHSDVALVRTLSYVKFGDLGKIWLNFPDFNRSRVYGLVYNDQSAGIVIERNDKPIALLNSDRKCAYAVSIGEGKAPGIVHGSGNREMIAEYIPNYLPIRIGDEVVTSGLDHLFFEGLKVGRVKAVVQLQGYQSAVVAPYYNAVLPGYFHVITQVR